MTLTPMTGSVATDELLTTAEVSDVLKTPVATLRYWRHNGSGPRSFRLGPRRVMYRRSDVLAWLEAQYADSGPAA